jgi:Zn-dependent protease with chaperone function
MHRKCTLLYLLGACFTVCAAIVVHTDALPCSLVLWCGKTRGGFILLLGAVVLPLVISVGRALYAGMVQIQATNRVIRHLHTLLKHPLTPSQHALAQSVGVQGRLDVVISGVAQAWCYGLIRPRVCVTTGLLGMLSSDELEAVLRHECYHLRRYDPLRTLLWTMCAAAGWGVEEQHQAHLKRELAADQEVIAAGQRQALASALLKLLIHERSSNLDAAQLAISGISVTAARIDQLLQERPMAPYAPLPLRHRWYLAPAAWSIMLLLCLSLMG